MIGIFTKVPDRGDIGRGLSLAAMAAALAWSGAARAQTAPAQDALPPADQTAPTATDDSAPLPDIVITGTLLHGVAPTGTNLIGVNRDDIVKNGAANTNDLLASIPQVGNFATQPVGTGQFGAPTVRPNIRNLGASGGSTTLVLLNGHRVVGAGVLQTTVDPSIVPPDAIDRIEIVPDGGSAIYGSDAIGGVINLITRKRFNGISGTARYGIGDDYRSFDANLTAGKDWGSGSLFVSYAYAWHDNIQGIDRDYVTANNTAKGGTDLRSTACAPGNITSLLTGITYAIPGFVPGTQNRCDQTNYADIYPRERRNTVFAGFDQQLNSSVEFSASAYWSQRKTQVLEAQGSTASGVITAANPYFRPVDFLPAELVAISFDDVFGHSLVSNQRFESWGVTPGFTFKLGGNWQLRTEANYGRSYNVVREGALNSAAIDAALAGFTTATALNPYNIAATNPAVLANIANFENFGDATQELAEARAVLDGTLATISGGDIRLAVGAEYHFENLQSRISQDKVNVFTNAISSYSSRDVKSVYGELMVPLIGAGNGSPGLRGLQISGSLRYDDYNDVGGTTNPKIGINYKPFDDLTIRGNWGTSFHAPSLADTTSLADSRAQILAFSPFLAPGASPANFNRPTIVLAGGNPDLIPEKAHTWSVGFDWKPRAVPGLVASVTYYNVKFTDAIGLVPFLSPTLFSNPIYSSFYILNPTLAQAQAKVGNLILSGASSLANLYVGTSPYILIDARRYNLGVVNTEGLDFNLAYFHKTGFGSINASFAGTYTLSRKSGSIAGGAFSDDLENGTGRMAFVAGLGGSIGDFSAQATLNHRSGFPILGVTNQDRVSAFNTVDLYFAYDLSKLLKDTKLTLNVDNIADQDPPYLNNATGYTNGGTLGRVFSIGARTKF